MGVLRPITQEPSSAVIEEIVGKKFERNFVMTLTLFRKKIPQIIVPNHIKNIHYLPEGKNSTYLPCVSNQNFRIFNSKSRKGREEINTGEEVYRLLEKIKEWFNLLVLQGTMIILLCFLPIRVLSRRLRPIFSILRSWLPNVTPSR